MLESGIYKLHNKITNNFYIGSTFTFNKRFGEHINALRGKYHRNRYLQNSYNKYGEQNFEFHILATCPTEYLTKLEQWFVDKLKPRYNLRKLIVDSQLGTTRSADTKNKMAKSKFGNTNALGAVRSQEFKDNVSNNLLNHKVSKETRNSISRTLTGRKQSKTTILKRATKNKIPVKFISNGVIMIFPSAKDASVIMGRSASFITLCCQGKKRSLDGKWRYV